MILTLGIIVAYLAVGLTLGRLLTTRYVRYRRNPERWRSTDAYATYTRQNSVMIAFITLTAWPAVAAYLIVRGFLVGLYRVLTKAMLPTELER